jgi:hypothetical protein
MKIIISLMMVLLPCTAFAATDCRIVEYPDHTEAVCVGDAEQTTASSQKTELGQIPMQELIPGQEESVASAQTPETEQPDVPPEMIVRNDLARLHGVYWLKSHPSQ